MVLNGEVIETYFHPSQRNKLWREFENKIAERNRSIELRNIPADAAMRLSDQRMADALREIPADAPMRLLDMRMADAPRESCDGNDGWMSQGRFVLGGRFLLENG